MGRRGVLALAAPLLLSSVLAAQEPLDPVRATVLREAQRYVDCWMRDDPACVRELTDRERLQAAGMVAQLPRPLTNATQTEKEFVRIELAEPWPPVAVDGALFAFVPYIDGRLLERPELRVKELRFIRMGYLVGASDDEGESWRFIHVDSGTTPPADAIDRVMPGYGDGPRPEVGGFIFSEGPLSESRWLQTTERRFVPVDDGIAYALTYEIREGLDGPIDFTVHYDNPVDPGRPLQFSGSLEPGQRVLEWQSPALRDFELGERYDVMIEGNDPDTGARRFRHREELLFLTTRDVWLAEVAPPPATAP